MKSKFKQNIQEAIQAELKKEAVFDLPRAALGHLRLSGVNSKMGKAQKRIDKEWAKTEEYANKKAEKMSASKNPRVARMGTQVAQNVDALDRTMKSAIAKIGDIVRLGADVPSEEFKSKRGFEDWLKRFNINPARLSKGPGNEYGRMANVYFAMRRAGVDPHTTDPKDWSELAMQKGKVEIPQIIAKAKELGIPGAELLGQGEEGVSKEQPAPQLSAKPKAKRAKPIIQLSPQQQQKAQAEPEQGEASQVPVQVPAEPQKEVPSFKKLAAKKIGQKASGALGFGEPGEELFTQMSEKIFDQLIKAWEQRKGTPVTPQIVQKAREKAEQIASKTIKPQEYAQAPGLKERPKIEDVHKYQFKSSGVQPEEEEEVTQPEVPTTMELPPTRVEPEEEAEPFPLKQEKIKKLPPWDPSGEGWEEEEEEPLTMKSFYDVDEKGQVKEKPPQPKGSKKEMSLTPFMQGLLKKQEQAAKSRFSGEVPIQKKTSKETGEEVTQVGMSPSEDPQGLGHSGTVQNKERMYKPKKGEKKRPSAKRKKNK